jgi:hypothetical protein
VVTGKARRGGIVALFQRVVTQPGAAQGVHPGVVARSAWKVRALPAEIRVMTVGWRKQGAVNCRFWLKRSSCPGGAGMSRRIEVAYR